MSLQFLSKEPQNVHTNLILNHYKQLYNKLKLITIITVPIEKVYSEIRKDVIKKIEIENNIIKNKFKKFIKNKLLHLHVSKRYHDIMYIIYILTYSYQQITSIDAYCSEILCLVWNYVRKNEDYKKIFYNQILSIYTEDGNIYCITGRITRLIDTVSGIITNENINIVMIRSEMMNKCIRIRQYYKGLDLQQKIKKELYNDYVKTKILNEDVFTNEINSWIDYI